MDVREKLEVIAHLGDHITYNEDIGICYDSALAKVIEDAYMELKNGVTVQELISQDELSWMGEDIAKLCIRYMEDYADFHGYASSKKVKAHIVRLLELEKEGRIAILPQPPKGE